MILNLSYLEEITGSDKEMMLEMLNLFIRDIPTHATNMENFLANNEISELGAEAHKVKPTLQYIGLTEMFELIKQIEFSAKNKAELNELPEAVQRFSVFAQEILPVLEEKRNEII